MAPGSVTLRPLSLHPRLLRLWLVQTDHVTLMLASDWSRHISLLGLRLIIKYQGEHLCIGATISSIAAASVWEMGSPSGRWRGCVKILNQDLILYLGQTKYIIHHTSYLFLAQHRNKMSLFKQDWNKQDMTGGQIDKQSWHDWNKRIESWSFFFSLNLIIVSDAAPNPHNVTGASASALPGNSSSTSSTSSTSSSSSSHSSSLPSYASHDRGTGNVRRQGNTNIFGNIFLNKICVTPVSTGAGSFSKVPFYSHKTLLKWRCRGWLRQIMWIFQRSVLYFAKDKISTIYKIFSGPTHSGVCKRRQLSWPVSR